MRTRFWAFFTMLVLATLPAWAQDTRGNISGTVTDSAGVIPGANVTIKSTGTGATQMLVTNNSGYFEAPLMQPGNYEVSVEMTGFKRLTQTGIVLSVGQSLSLKLTLEVGQIAENITVVGEAPLLDTSAVKSGQNFDQSMIDGLPMASDQPILLVKFSQGMVSPTTQQLVLQGQIDGPNGGAGSPVGGVGSINWTLDGATNAGNNRRMASSPNADIVQEMRVETSNFDAAQGHGTGASVSLMTKAGTNATRGTFNYQYWNAGINSINPQQKLQFAQRPDTAKIYNSGHSNNGAFTLGGPVVLPKLINGRNKLFYFVNYQQNLDDSAARNTPTSRVPTSQAELNGDFSDLLKLPSPTQYIIYDPLTVRPDPARPGSFIRDPFPNNIIPKERFTNPDGTYRNPLFALFKDMMPAPNQNFIENGAVPDNNYYQGATPNLTSAKNYGARLDYNLSAKDRVFFRYAGTKFHEQLGDWTYETKYKGLHTNDKTRSSWAYTGSWTRVMSGGMVIDSSVSTNRFYEDQQRRQAHNYKPSDVGLPTYLDQFCQAASNCMMPVIQVGGYQTIGLTANGGLQSTNLQGQSSVTSIMGTHTFHGGVDLRRSKYESGLITAGNVNSTWVFDNTYTRAADTTAVFPSSTIGTSIAALMLGIPTQVTIGSDAPISATNPYYGAFFQDSWRATQNLTLGAGLRFEYEDGIKELKNRVITGFDPNATLAITQGAEAAYARNPIPQVALNDFHARGGSVFATAPGASKTWSGEGMWMPRLSLGYKLGDKTVIKSGYGMFFDVLTAADYQNYNQLGYSVTTTSVSSTDFGQTWLLGDPKNGLLATANPFPVRNTGSRFEAPVGDALGADTIDGTPFTRENQDHKHARVQRWRIGVQRELFGTTAVEVAYSGSYADRVEMAIQQSYVPEQYYVGGNSRDASAQTLLQQSVTNPFNINNFGLLQASNPALYARMAGNAFFTSTTTQRQNLIRAYPQLTFGTGTACSATATANCPLTLADLPLGIVKSHNLEITVNRRYAHGLSANLAFSANHVVENRTVELYDQKPTLWQPSQNGRPWSLRGGAVYELPFGSNKAFLQEGFVSKILGGWQTAGTVEYQPGALINWNNLFFNGALKNIAKKHPEIALQSDGSIDLSKTWFNVDAGFEKSGTAQPAAFQKRSFPFRVDGVRGPGLFLVNMNVGRNFPIGGNRSFQFRVDVQNLFNSVLWGNPTVDPTSTNFGRITTATNSIMRFITFIGKVTF
jgi:hypothetical protein